MFRFAVGFLTGSVLLLGAAVSGSTQDLRPGPFVLEDPTRFEEGCYDPCMCPILIREDVEGRFTLVSTGIAGGFMTFDVIDVVWKVNEDGLEFRGSGTYRISLDVDTRQEMVLDLSRNGGDAERFQSGLVPAHQPFQGIHIAVSRNDFTCFDTAFEIHAAHGEQPITWGAIKSLFAIH